MFLVFLCTTVLMHLLEINFRQNNVWQFALIVALILPKIQIFIKTSIDIYEYITHSRKNDV